MKQVRIQPVSDTVHLVDIECNCGATGLQNIETQKYSFKHSVTLGGEDVRLECVCGTKYRIHPQSNHFHIFQE